MEKEFLDFLPLSEVSAKGTRKRRIGYKPYTGIALLAAFAVFAVCIPNTICRIMGIFVMAVAALVQFTVRDRHVMDIYTEGVLFYEHRDDSRAAFFPYTSIEGWSVRRNKGSGQTVLLLLDDQRFVMTDTFSLVKAENVLFSVMPGKEIRA